MENRKIIIRTTKGDSLLESFHLHTLEQTLLANKLPTNLFQGYITKNGEIKPIPLNKKINEIDSDSEIIIQCLRNIDFSKVIAQYSDIKVQENSITLLRNLNLTEEVCFDEVIEINAEQAIEIVKHRVTDFIKEYSKSKKVLVGISGGGDSNTLVKSLTEIEDLEVTCFTVTFEEIWHTNSIDRAKELCQNHNSNHLVFTPSDIENAFKMKGTLSSFYNDFKNIFGDDTDEFFATYLISKVARYICKEYDINEYCLGYNREDIFAELLYSILNGRKPLSYPTRKFNEINLLMPLWEIPKKILDACYPKYSIDNYSERIENTTNQRHNIYYLSHMIEDANHNLGFSMMMGLKELMSNLNGWSDFDFDKTNDLFINKYASEKTLKEFLELYSKYF